eukprot:CAMPEP_0183351128 /NCGR_PEP_ID=MMETSP0164_2-20130417/23379_1 /TAXON_ID=221442 /ORGANISM="Coccolithus pelagicus ssp braarudi, Strain PLY182g" /LENGTH=64 /DNA_ID=CAMNT_0025523235 /DNA_START=440 /DNA_END=634 /DNA_ORIENTATION=-
MHENWVVLASENCGESSKQRVDVHGDERLAVRRHREGERINALIGDPLAHLWWVIAFCEAHKGA